MTDTASSPSVPKSWHTPEYLSFVDRFIVENEVRSVTVFGQGPLGAVLESRLGSGPMAGSGADGASAPPRPGAWSVAIRYHDGVDGLPGGDLLIAAEVLQRLPTRTILGHVAAMRTLYRFILITDAVFPGGLPNIDVPEGGSRPIHPGKAPFGFPGAVVSTHFDATAGSITKYLTYLVYGREEHIL